MTTTNSSKQTMEEQINSKTFCPTCGSEVGVHSSDEGTHHYVSITNDLLQKIESYKQVLKMADVPQLLIDHPEFIRSSPLTKEDIEWAEKKISNLK